MKSIELGEILESIDMLRSSLNKLARTADSLQNERVQEISRELDQLIVRYYRLH